MPCGLPSSRSTCAPASIACLHASCRSSVPLGRTTATFSPTHDRTGSSSWCMLDVHAIRTKDLQALSPAELAQLAAQMLAHITEQSKHIDAQSKRIDSQAQAIKWRDAKIESITFQLARLKAWKFGAKSER